MIDTKKLERKIKKVEKKQGCSLIFESAKKLIIKVQKEWGSGTQELGFKNFVERCAEELELHYNYCRVAFSYLGGFKKGPVVFIKKLHSGEGVQKLFKSKTTEKYPFRSYHH